MQNCNDLCQDKQFKRSNILSGITDRMSSSTQNFFNGFYVGTTLGAVLMQTLLQLNDATLRTVHQSISLCMLQQH